MPEADRIRDAYAGYDASRAVRRRRSEVNIGNEVIRAERTRRLRGLLAEHGFLPLEHRRVLDVGCGYGMVLSEMVELGAVPDNLHGVDLLPDRIETARRRYPHIQFQRANAEALAFPDESFDLVLVFTLFSSILDEEMAFNVASEVRRVVKPRGGVVWYDFRLDNPRNPHTRGKRKRDIARLFPSFDLHLAPITVLPPLTRLLGPATRELYPVLATIPLLRTHYLGLLRKPAA